MVQKRVKVYFLSLREDTIKRGFWDYALIEDLLSGFESLEVDSLPETELAVVVVPARSHKEYEEKLDSELRKIKKGVLMVMGDEENVFDIEKITHKELSIWVQNPKPGKHDKYTRLGTGYAPKVKDCINLPIKSLDWFFAGQVTHSRREECASKLRNMSGGEMIESQGFTQGIDPDSYFKKLSNSKVAPCPSGPQTPDSFRLFEALELGCVPIADTKTPKEDWSGFWEWLFQEPIPFVEIKNWDDLEGYTKDCVEKYPVMNNRIQAWWLRYKQNLKKKLYDQLGISCGEVTVMIPVSPIPSHPNIDIISETISTVRKNLPDAEIIITFDGVRQEQKDSRDDYEEQIRRVLWECRQWGNVRPYIFDDHIHQVGMARKVIDEVYTPLLLYVEQDTPLVVDEPIEWEKLKNFIYSGVSNVIRFHFEGSVPKEHEYLMIGKPEDGLLKTVQWSQRPHLASTAFYKRMLSEHFSAKSNCFIEDLIHGRLLNDWNQFGEQGWLQWRLHIYHPDTGNIKRSYNLDGRAGTKKYDDTQIF